MCCVVVQHHGIPISQSPPQLDQNTFNQISAHSMHLPPELLHKLLQSQVMTKEWKHALSSASLVCKQWCLPSQLTLKEKAVLTSTKQARCYFKQSEEQHTRPILLVITGPETLTCHTFQTGFPLPGRMFTALKTLAVDGCYNSGINIITQILRASPNLDSLTCIGFFLDSHFCSQVLESASSMCRKISQLVQTSKFQPLLSLN